MPGMATPAELAQLDALTGTDAEIAFLVLMVRHHRAGVQMAQAAVEHAARPEVRALAQSMIDGQAHEIRQMQQMHLARGVTA